MAGALCVKRYVGLGGWAGAGAMLLEKKGTSRGEWAAPPLPQLLSCNAACPTLPRPTSTPPLQGRLLHYFAPAASTGGSGGAAPNWCEIHTF